MSAVLVFGAPVVGWATFLGFAAVIVVGGGALLLATAWVER